jgi:sec-independent protein translocase protein TatA
MKVMFALGGLGGWEWVIVVLAILLLFGAKKIPELARGLGSGIKEFKKATREVTDEIQNADDKPAAQSKSTPNSQSPPAQTVSQTPAPPKA